MPHMAADNASGARSFLNANVAQAAANRFKAVCRIFAPYLILPVSDGIPSLTGHAAAHFAVPLVFNGSSALHREQFCFRRQESTRMFVIVAAFEKPWRPFRQYI